MILQAVMTPALLSNPQIKNDFKNKLTNTTNEIYNGCTVVRISYVVYQLTKTNIQSSGEFETTFLSNILKIFTSANYLTDSKQLGKI